MRSTVMWSFLSLVALSTTSLVAGCDSDAKLAKSGVGESCDSSADCEDDLNCIQGACYKSAPGGGGGGEGGDSTVGPTPPVLGGEGESCTKRADCEDGLACLNQRCTAAVGEGGAGNVPVRLGRVHEACDVSADCEAGLACRVDPAVSPLVSVCTPAGGAVQATGKSCNGAECVEDADCCQLPTQLFATLGAKSCTELAALVEAIDCAAAVTVKEKTQCFANTAYCECDSTWSCSEAGTCVYEAKCSEDGLDAPDGCPTYSRSGRSVKAETICNEAGLCAPETVAVKGCTTDASCTDQPVADDVNDTCVKGECTCVKETKQCFRKCNDDLDCSAGTPAIPDNPQTVFNEAQAASPPRVCDKDLSLCIPADQCKTNEACVRRLNDINAVCLEGTCRTSCNDDYDCNEGGISTSFTAVCNANKICEPLGCEDDSECPGTASGVKLFCTAPFVPTPGTNVASAITD